MANDNYKRRFAVYTRAHVADPAYLAPLWEELPTGEVVYYSDISELKEVVAQVEYYIAFEAGRSQENQDICKLFGVDDFMQLTKLAKKVKKK